MERTGSASFGGFLEEQGRRETVLLGRDWARKGRQGKQWFALGCRGMVWRGEAGVEEIGNARKGVERQERFGLVATGAFWMARRAEDWGARNGSAGVGG